MRPLGWRYESHRHALAARGIHTSYYSKKRVDYIKGGLADKSKVSDFCPVQLAKGVKVEREHTSDPKIAREIAMDHLKEDSEYYVKLEKMERKKSRRYNYVPTYVVSDMPLIAGDAIGTVGAEAVSLMPVAVPLLMIAGGTVLAKKTYDKTKKKYHYVKAWDEPKVVPGEEVTIPDQMGPKSAAIYEGMPDVLKRPEREEKSMLLNPTQSVRLRASERVVPVAPDILRENLEAEHAVRAREIVGGTVGYMVPPKATPREEFVAGLMKIPKEESYSAPTPRQQEMREIIRHVEGEEAAEQYPNIQHKFFAVKS
jgi:hypothetical protein